MHLLTALVLTLTLRHGNAFTSLAPVAAAGGVTPRVGRAVLLRRGRRRSAIDAAATTASIAAPPAGRPPARAPETDRAVDGRAAADAASASEKPPPPPPPPTNNNWVEDVTSVESALVRGAVPLEPEALADVADALITRGVARIDGLLDADRATALRAHILALEVSRGGGSVRSLSCPTSQL